METNIRLRVDKLYGVLGFFSVIVQSRTLLTQPRYHVFDEGSVEQVDPFLFYL